jgi:hypothetical protein
MAIQSYKKTFVSNSSTLLASGATVENIAVAQVGILDGITNVATTAPTYAKNKALKFVWGTPDLSYLLTNSGVPNQNDYSKLVRGKAITSFKGVKAKRGQQEVVTIGWSGDTSDENTLFAEPGEVKWLFLKLTGGPIDKKFSLQGVTRQYSVSAGTIDDTDPIDTRILADDLVKQINSDNYINTFVKAGALYFPSSTPGGADTDYEFLLRVCDTRDNAALGNVQSQYPNDTVKRISTEGAKSVYQIVRDTNSLPTAFSTVDTTLIPDCDECPTGYTFTDYGFAYKVVRADAGSAGNLTTLKSDYGISTSTELGSRVLYESGVSTYIIVADATISAAVGTDVLTFLGDARAACVLSSTSTVGWQSGDTFTTYTKDYTLTIADDHCGDDRLTDIQAAFPSLSVSLVAESSGECVHTYSTSVKSNRVQLGCSIDQIKWNKPQAFEGVEWDEVPGSFDGTQYKVGVRIEATFVPYVTDNNETFGYFPAYEQQAVHIQASEFDPNYNNAPESEVSHWVIRKIQGFEQAIGSGIGVRVFEKESLSYELRERSFDPVVRQIENYQFQAQVDKYYDEYILGFDFDYKVGGFADRYTDAYKLHVFFPEGQGKNFEAAINGYLSSVSVNIDPVVL